MTNLESGILQLTKRGDGHLVNPDRLTDPVVVPAKLIRTYRLPHGATVTGSQQGDRLTSIETVGGLAPEAFRQRTPFKRLVAIDPTERFNLAASGETSMRLIDLIAPIGKGTRGLIVAPPKAGKTILLEQMARSIHTIEPETRLIMLLIDERPEEVTHFRRALPGAEVFASSSDQPLEEHVNLAELMLAHIRTELECGRNVVVMVDSPTRLVRAFNLRGSRSNRGRTLSGGVDAEALQIPRRFFGLARNIEHGGSVTILATVLIETGSRMDQFIYEEFKGTGNNEIVLDRALAEAYIFPAINLAASSTRKEDRLYSPDESQQLTQLRRELVGRPLPEAMLQLLSLLDQYPTNEELLQSVNGQN
ncbi:MAG TPA: transcription termination factor Rho [Anaerolineae bacterium]|nr:transcription termination factor Rho [Anaerolineae bacterium]